MASKALLIVDQHPELKTLFARFDELEAQAKERMKFFEMQADKMKEEYDQKYKLLWKDVEAKLEEDGLMPEKYDPKKHNLRYDKTTSVLTWYTSHDEGNCGGLPEGLKSLLKMMMDREGK